MTETTAHVHHRIDYIELASADIEADKRFYTGAFGWEFTDYGPEYAGIRDPRDPAAEMGGLNAGSPVETGIADRATDQPASQPEHRRAGPLVLLYTDDVDASAAAVPAAGGVVTAAPYEFPGGRRFHFTDPSGNELGAWGAR